VSSAAGIPRVLVTCPPFLQVIDEYREEFEQKGIDAITPVVKQQLSEDELIDIIGDVVGVIAGDDPFTERVIGAAPKLKALIKWGIGIDCIDVGALRDRDIFFANTPGMFGEEVADVAMGYVLLLARHLLAIDRSVRDGGWSKPSGVSLSQKTLGVVGLGNVGAAVLKRADAFGMRLQGYDLVPEAVANTKGLLAQSVDLETLVATSDFVVLCCSLTEDNRHLVDAGLLRKFKDGAYLINVSRGPLVHEDALVDALESGKIIAAALDVFETEPLPNASELRRFPQCIFGSHNGSNTAEAVHRVNRVSLDMMYEQLGVKQ